MAMQCLTYLEHSGNSYNGLKIAGLFVTVQKVFQLFSKDLYINTHTSGNTE